MVRAILVCAVVLGAASPALATTGGPTELEVLGYDAGDHKIYFVETRFDESGVAPAVYFVHTAGARIGKVTRVMSITRGVDTADDPLALVGRRVDRLRKRLAPLAGLATGAHVDHTRASPQLATTLALARTAAGTVQVKDWLDQTMRACDRVALQLTHGERSGRIELTDCFRGSTGVVTAYPIPDSSATFVVVTSRPILYELGYAVEQPLLLVRTAP
jgi:hypothetical protein